MDLCEELRKARAAKHLRQWQVAELIGVTQQAISDWEKGGGIDEEHWQSIKELLGVDVSASISMREATRSPAVQIHGQEIGSVIVGSDKISNGQQQPGCIHEEEF